MATFGKATFNAARYASSRPTYPRQLYDFIFKYHERAKGARWDLAIDVGCGTGQATVELTPFKRVIGLDPSAKMIEQARESVRTRLAGLDLSTQIEFEQSSAEELKPLQDGSVDLLTAAQACHWFNWDRFWPEVARVLRKDGTLAVWGYSEFRLSRYPTATKLINQYMQGSDPKNSLGPFWERPGRTILDNHLLDVPAPEAVAPGQFSAFERVFFAGAHEPALPDPRPVILRKTLTWDELRGYFYTASALHTFAEQNPEDAQRADGDLATRFQRSLKEEVARVDGKGLPKDEDTVDIEWPLTLILARRA
ncbi:S-adenosyl-L-methionine-dependent methyltransferase [Dichomitus squalens]|uniref:S-adenosyl-L-methionine-dependent methyltransferase n=1 Tax=Dichomitus squalens TaxID=114155 RepID=A0A4Q9MY14_9APHY|nr:S-adenosyl-L-methionine-dependent methyltransferase [Dichomitus squalens]TBU40095.1 S-adenosyl-L-methionine-dependent methyltransferase [Dichomitus squalens]